MHAEQTVRHQAPDAAHDREADAVLAACRVLVAISAQSLAAVEDIADLTEVRALVAIASRGSSSSQRAGRRHQIHLTRASRLCDRLVANGLIDRSRRSGGPAAADVDADADGQQVVQEVMRRRRAAFQPILDRMSEEISTQRRAE